MIRTYITESEVAEFIIKMERLEGDIPADSFLGRLAIAMRASNLAGIGIEIAVVKDKK